MQVGNGHYQNDAFPNDIVGDQGCWMSFGTWMGGEGLKENIWNVRRKCLVSGIFINAFSKSIILPYHALQ